MSIKYSILWNNMVQHYFRLICPEQTLKSEEHGSLTCTCNSYKIPLQACLQATKNLQAVMNSGMWLTGGLAWCLCIPVSGEKPGIQKMSCTCNAKLKIALTAVALLWNIQNLLTVPKSKRVIDLGTKVFQKALLSRMQMNMKGSRKINAIIFRKESLTKKERPILTCKKTTRKRQPIFRMSSTTVGRNCISVVNWIIPAFE